MNIKVPIAILACRAVRLLARVLHKGGTAKPGEIALRICPGLLGVVSRGVKTVVVTGTNGKTTTSRIIEEAFDEADLHYIANRSGANLISGITTEFALRSSIFGKNRCSHAVIECDEAACRKTLAYLRPECVVVTNLFRDQLDRFGDVSVTLENIREGLAKVPATLMILNADCPMSASLSASLPNPARFFGMSPKAADGRGEAIVCPLCGGKLDYDWHSFGHLGGYRCADCGFARPEAGTAVSAIHSAGASSTEVSLCFGGDERRVRVNLPALYNVYNAAAAAAALDAMGFQSKDIVEALEDFDCGFGRMERFELGREGARMMLVKNPTGCDQVINFLSGLDQDFDAVLCVNDRTGDGTDVSWIYETDFEKLVASRCDRIYVSGIRRTDMALRLKYAGAAAGRVLIRDSYAALVDELQASDKPLYLIPTYSAMLELRSAIVAKIGGSEFWED